MEVKVKLMGVLRSQAPPGDTLELPAGATINDLLAALSIPANQVMLVSVNGKHQRDRSQKLAPHDEVMVLPPAGGG